MVSGNQESGAAISPWEAGRFMRTVSDAEVRCSRGFLRCRPEKWFPGFAAQWLPLAHSLGVEFKVLDVKPLMQAESPADVQFVGTVDGEPIALSTDETSARILVEATAPGMLGSIEAAGGPVVLEYLARRFLTSLGAAWTGPQSSLVQFEPEMKFPAVGAVAEVRFAFSINGSPCQATVSLGKFLVERLDTLWRRQIQSTARAVDAGSTVALEVAQLAVPPSMLADYLRSGTLIDLEARASDALTLRVGTKAWQAARGCLSNGRYAFEMTGGAVQSPSLPEGTTRLSISLGAVRLDGAVVAELSQPGAMWETQIPVSDRVELLINGESVGEGRLGLYEGRFAVTVD